MAMPDMSNMPKISLSRNQIIMIGGGLLLVVIVVVLFMFSGKGETAPPVTLKVWGTDTKEAFGPLAEGYQALRTNATIEYTQVPAAGYTDTLLTALAAGTGPDIFMIGNHDLLRRGDLLVPAPATQISFADLQGYFPQAAAQDFAYEESIYALPLYMDTLRVVYNKQMFDQAGIALPPTTWQEVLDMVPQLRSVDAQGQISRAAIALGGSEQSVEHGTDILNMLMLQNGAVLADDRGMPSFTDNNAAAAAFQFYLQFADAGSPMYTWSDAQGNSLESFTAQRTAMAFAYQRDLANIRAQAPFLDFGVIPAPQISAEQAVSYPSYQGLAVWVGSQVQPWAWDFVIFAATNPAAQEAYLTATGRPAALRTLIAQQEDRSPLTARSWKMGDYDKIKTIFSSAIQNVLTGAKNPEAALKDAESQARQLVAE